LPLSYSFAEGFNYCGIDLERACRHSSRWMRSHLVGDVARGLCAPVSLLSGLWLTLFNLIWGFCLLWPFVVLSVGLRIAWGYKERVCAPSASAVLALTQTMGSCPG